MAIVTTVVVGQRPPELEALIARRRALGTDGFDEVWDGVYHMVPYAHSDHGQVEGELAALLHPMARSAGLVSSGPINIGVADDYRVPDRALLRRPARAVWVPTAAMVIEILSPEDETFAKFDFYASRGVEELLVADPAGRTIRIWSLGESKRYVEVARSGLLGISCGDLAAQIAWPGE